jgi:UDPglucose 6-dehydrogenase
MNICVVGAGYVGLVTGAVFADLGNEVVCVDNVADKIDALQAGRLPIYEPGLEEMVTRNVGDGRLSFTIDLTAAVRRSVIVFIAVGTPPKVDGQTDLSAVEAVAREIGRAMERYTVVVNKSTVPVGTGEFVREVIERHQTQPVSFDVVSNPEFLREGSAIEDTLRPDRIVIGAPTQQVAMTLLELYAPLERPMIITDVPSAEMIKYASNAFLATKISFINAVANLCEAVNADVREVSLGMGYDPRIGFEFLHPGPGYGGSCFPKDTAALNHTAEVAGYDFSLLRGVVDVNRRQHERIIEKLRDAAGGSLEGVTVGVWGLTFKANTDDLRDSPALVVSRALLDEGAVVHAYDPAITDGGPTPVPGLDVVTDAYDAAKGAQVLALLTEWDEFRWLDFGRVVDAMSAPRALIDARNLLDPAAMRRRGFAYQGVGR